MIGSAVIRRLRRVRQEERGVVLVLVAISMVFMLGIVGLAVDVGSWYQTQRQAQAAADAAALAGSQDLPGSPTSATADATSYVNKNITGATTSVLTPYLSSSSTVQVTVRVTASVWFAKIFGISAPTVTATAAATKSGGSSAAIFSSDSNCGNQALTVNGGNISGTVHSNGSFIMNGNNDAFGPSSFGGPNACNYLGNGFGNTYGGAPLPTRDSTLEPWPDDYSVSPPACTYTQPSFTFQGDDGATLPAGVYCATGQITFNGSNLKGNVSFIANSFNMNGSAETFTPYTQNLLFYQTGSGTLDINGSSFVNLGTVFAPNGSVLLNGSSGTVSGFIEALDVTINGTGLTFVGTGPSSGGASALVQ